MPQGLDLDLESLRILFGRSSLGLRRSGTGHCSRGSRSWPPCGGATWSTAWRGAACCTTAAAHRKAVCVERSVACCKPGILPERRCEELEASEWELIGQVWSSVTLEVASNSGQGRDRGLLGQGAPCIAAPVELSACCERYVGSRKGAIGVL